VSRGLSREAFDCRCIVCFVVSYLVVMEILAVVRVRLVFG
jgi:hypothetical protein